METSEVTIKLGGTKPTNRQYESARADVSVTFRLDASEQAAFTAGMREPWTKMRAKVQEMMFEALSDATETLQGRKATDALDNMSPEELVKLARKAKEIHE